MTASQQKVVQYLGEARANENALFRVLRSQIAITPRGSYRSVLVDHLGETRRHSERLAERLEDLGQRAGILTSAVGAAENAIGQLLALSRTPLELLRGSAAKEKVLKSAKDACASEAFEIASYAALEQIATAAGDAQTAELAASMRQDEERMLERIMCEIPKLADSTYNANIDGDSSYELSTTGAGETVTDIGAAAKRRARKSADTVKRNGRQARKVPSVDRAEGQVTGALASANDLAIRGYDELNVDQITGRLPGLSQIDLAEINAYEHDHENRLAVLSRVSVLQGDEPWAGYDELTANEVQDALKAGGEHLANDVRAYESAHKARAGVLNAADRERSNA